MARSGIVGAVIGVLAITSLADVGAAAPSAAATARVAAAASPSAAPVTQGHTQCVPWPKPTSPGLKCTGTFSGGTAWNPWTWHNISQQPVVTVSQAKDLTDQGVQITWSNFTPTLASSVAGPNTSSTTPLYSVSIFECQGTNPDASNGFVETPGTTQQCYTPPVGSPASAANHGPPNAVVESTADTSSPPRNLKAPPGCTHSASSGFPLSSPLAYQPPHSQNYCKSSWDGGNPATWTGQADFHVEAPTPRSKGGFFTCAPSAPCSLVIVPNFGGTPVVKQGNFSWTDTSRCGQHYVGGGADPATADPRLLGTPHAPYGGTGDLQEGTDLPFAGSDSLPVSGGVSNVQGESAACWAANRIVIPLSFAPKSSNCPNKTPEFYAQGSPMMQTQMLQWQAGWCTGRSPLTLNYTFNSESVARGEFLASGTQAGGARTDMALVTLPVTAAEQGASHRRFTYAPLANSGAGIAYLIDDQKTGTQINRLVLDPRLLAKLVTESYTLAYGCTSADHKTPGLFCDPAVWGSGNNPFSLYQDAEFGVLNKHCQPFGRPADYACGSADWPPRNDFTGGTAGTYQGVFLPTVLGPDNDMTYDLTNVIASDADAKAFLNGSTDPWSQRVNSNYLHVSFPAQSLSILDQGYTKPLTCNPPSLGGCGFNPQIPDATMQAAWNPQQDLDTIAGDLLTFQPTAAVPNASCPLPQGVGCMRASQLVTTSGMPPQYAGDRDLLSELDLGDIMGYHFPSAEVVNAAGNAVAPTQASVEAAVSSMKTNPDRITQFVDPASAGQNAYPLAMVDYAMVPTCGLSHAQASAIADFLTKAATTGQTQGEAPGDLAPGYYPLTAKQKSQTLTAARDVKEQTCTSPPPDHTVNGHHTPGGTGTGTGTTTTGSSSSHGHGKTAGGHGSPSAGPSPLSHPTSAAFGQKSADSGMAGLLLLLAIITGVLLVLGAPAAWVITVTGRWPAVLRRVRAVPASLRAGLGRLAGLVIRRA